MDVADNAFDCYLLADVLLCIIRRNRLCGSRHGNQSGRECK